ncbi:MAG: cytochrome c [Actinomycetota bacterium]
MVGRSSGLASASGLALAVALLLGACAGGIDTGPAAPGVAIDPVEAGRALAVERNCVSCHSADGSTGVGPTWRGLYGSTERLTNGTNVTVDRTYLARSIREPGTEIVAGFDVVEMPTLDLTPFEIEALVAYIESLG